MVYEDKGLLKSLILQVCKHQMLEQHAKGNEIHSPTCLVSYRPKTNQIYVASNTLVFAYTPTWID